jgi:pimeloyl-ACP methyl ester carboxylesterase
VASYITKFSGAGCPAVTVNCRRCGLSELGDSDDFNPSSIMADIHYVMTTHAMLLLNDDNGNNVVLVGHSIGGRMTMSYAAAYPKQFDALVIEDMDIGHHVLNIDSPIAKTADRGSTVNFQCKLEFDSNSNSRQDIFGRFEAVKYPATIVQGWLDEGRIRWIKDECNNSDKKEDSYYYSDVNPAFRRLCYEQFFDNGDLLLGVDTWKQIAQQQQQ